MVLLREVIGDVLRHARTSQGRTLREVSNSARVSLGYLSEVERGPKRALDGYREALSLWPSSLIAARGVERLGSLKVCPGGLL